MEYWSWLWPAVAIWAADRSLRLVRLVYCNLHVNITLDGLRRTRSWASYDKASNIVRLRVRPGTLQLAPGQYFFLYQPFRLTGWESHPFTVGAWSYGPEVPAESKSGDIDQVPLLSEPPSGSADTDPAAESPGLQLIFWIRPYDGWTRQLRDECLRSPDRTRPVTLLLEGPYGGPFPLWHYDSVLFIVGGTGIAAAVPYIQEHLRRSATGSTRTCDLHLVWTSRQMSFWAGIATQELQPALACSQLRASLYMTGTGGSDPAASARLADSGVEMATGRPDLTSVVVRHVEQARLSECSTAVVVCGMADETRTGVSKAMRRGYEVRYVEESFSW